MHWSCTILGWFTPSQGDTAAEALGTWTSFKKGTLGLIRAAEKFEFAKGYRFSTYCFNWITQAVRRYVGDTGNLIRAHVRDQVNKVYRERAIEQSKTGMEPVLRSSLKLGMDKQKTKEILEVRNLAISLDAPRYDDDDGALVDTLTTDQYGDTTGNAEQDSLHRFLGEAVDRLRPTSSGSRRAMGFARRSPALDEIATGWASVGSGSAAGALCPQETEGSGRCSGSIHGLPAGRLRLTFIGHQVRKRLLELG